MNPTLLRLGLLCASFCHAVAAPEIRHFAPHAVVPGRTTVLTFSGSGLDSVSNLWTTFGAMGRRIPNTNASLISFSVTCPDLAPGVHALQLIGPEGASNFQLLLVDSLPTAAHQNDHQQRASALRVIPPIAVDCILKSEQIDYYTFIAKAGERYAIEVIAPRIGSQMDPVARVLNPQGEEILFCDDGGGVWKDARFEFTPPLDGDYTIALHDIGYGGGNAFDYRFRISRDPLVWYTFPLVDSSEEGGVLEKIGAGVSSNVGGSPLNPSPGPLLTGLPQVAEVEPNDNQPAASRLNPPILLHGRIGSARDVDRFEFTARKNQKLIFQSQTRSLGSPCDLVLRINKPDGTSIVQSNLNSANDAAVTNEFSEDGTFQLEVGELSGTAPANAPYRIEVREFEPGFTLAVEENIINVKAGGIAKLKVSAKRFEYEGPIQLNFASALLGFDLENAIIPENENETEVVIKNKTNQPGTWEVRTLIGRMSKEHGTGFSTIVSTDPALRKAFPLLLIPPSALDGVIVISTTRP